MIMVMSMTIIYYYNGDNGDTCVVIMVIMVIMYKYVVVIMVIIDNGDYVCVHSCWCAFLPILSRTRNEESWSEHNAVEERGFRQCLCGTPKQ